MKLIELLTSIDKLEDETMTGNTRGYVYFKTREIKELTIPRITRDYATREGLEYAGTSLEFHGLTKTWVMMGQPDRIVPNNPTLETILPSLHFRAWKHLSREGKDTRIVGFVVLTEEELEEKIKDLPIYEDVKSGKQKAFGADYYMRKAIGA